MADHIDYFLEHVKTFEDMAHANLLSFIGVLDGNVWGGSIFPDHLPSMKNLRDLSSFNIVTTNGQGNDCSVEKQRSYLDFLCRPAMAGALLHVLKHDPRVYVRVEKRDRILFDNHVYGNFIGWNDSSKAHSMFPFTMVGSEVATHMYPGYRVHPYNLVRPSSLPRRVWNKFLWRNFKHTPDSLKWLKRRAIEKRILEESDAVFFVVSAKEFCGDLADKIVLDHVRTLKRFGS